MVSGHSKQRNPQTIFLRESGAEQDDFGKVEPEFDQRCHTSQKKKYLAYTVQMIEQFPTIFCGVAHQSSIIVKGAQCPNMVSSTEESGVLRYFD